MQTLRIEKQSVQSLLIVMLFGNTELSTGTGFIVDTKRGPALVTNLHNVTGRNPTTGEPLASHGGVPDQIAILHNVAGKLGSWQSSVEPLYDDLGNKLWFEHPVLGG